MKTGGFGRPFSFVGVFEGVFPGADGSMPDASGEVEGNGPPAPVCHGEREYELRTRVQLCVSCSGRVVKPVWQKG